MSKLFESSKINGMTLANRFVRSATWEGMAADDGAVTPKLIETMVNLANGGVGLIISSHAYISPEGQASPWQLGIDNDECIDGLQEMTAAVHASGAKIVMQLAHAGVYADEHVIGQPPLVVSNFEGQSESPRHEITADDIRMLVAAFSNAARRAKSAGFDGVQIHAAHGYLLSQFLSPAFNQRRDEYGGDITNRSRVIFEVYQAIRKTVSRTYPVLMKINCRDFIPNGLMPEDSLQVGIILANAGLDAIELSGGMVMSKPKNSPSRPQINAENKEAYFKEDAVSFKKKISIPLILVGGIRSFGVAERLVEDGFADYISLSRPFIREPKLINRWKAGDRRKATCKSDNLCLRPALNGDGIYCVTERRERAKQGVPI